MSDVTCAKCREPWDAYGAQHGDMTMDEYRRFRRGEGCPSCGFGKVCKACGGRKVETSRSEGAPSDPSCGLCGGRNTARALRAVVPGSGPGMDGNVWTGFDPRFRRWPEDVPFPEDEFNERGELVVGRDGAAQEAYVICPICRPKLPACGWCGGSGKHQAATRDEDTDSIIAHATSAMEGFDDFDPEEVL